MLVSGQFKGDENDDHNIIAANIVMMPRKLKVLKF